MTTLFLRIYDYLSTHRALLWGCMFGLLTLLIVAAVGLRYKEDITDFLPVDDEYRESMEVYQQLSDASRIVIIFEGEAPDELCDAVDQFEEECLRQGLNPDLLTCEVDVNAFIERLQFVQAHAPLFMGETDYSRLDTLLTPEGMRHALERDKQMLSMPGSGVLQQVIAGDPLGLFPLSMGANGQYAAASAAFTSYNGYMMSADGTKAFAFYTSPYGSMESGQNAALVDSLENVLETINLEPVSARLLGAPVVAVGNARCIKRDSLLCIGLSVLLIAALLLYSFPRKRDLLLILLSVSFGWLFGMAMLRLCAGQVSVIVLGIGSVLIGLAVNYPLHLLVHQRYTTSVRQTLQEVLSPLTIGNITTVGAFLALLPIQATALRDLGIFAASMLLGTILFCALFLPHLMSAEATPLRELPIGRSPHILSTSGWSRTLPQIGLTLVTLFALGYLLFVPGNRFDSNLSHINYMTAEQRADFAYFEQLSTINAKLSTETYLASSAREELQRRYEIWETYWADKDCAALLNDFRQTATNAGFRDEAFAPFEQMLIRPIGLTSTIDPKSCSSAELASAFPGRFDAEALNSRMASALSDNFDYLGFVCSAIVFVFLLISFRSFWLALIAFLPMAVAWIWILAIMQLTGLQFNIVNIILATFLFGQGDDYTIFMLEGALHEQRTGQPMLPQFKQSILLSALIMLVSMGVLLFARHPAMHSLGAVTLVGMTAVVIAAWLLPHMLINWKKR